MFWKQSSLFYQINQSHFLCYGVKLQHQRALKNVSYGTLDSNWVLVKTSLNRLPVNLNSVAFLPTIFNYTVKNLGEKKDTSVMLDTQNLVMKAQK